MAGNQPTSSAPSELRIVDGPGTGQTLPLTDRLVIGRDRIADLVLTDEEISRRHVRITRENGQARVEDLNSTNGTYINGERLYAPRDIGAGDQIEVGNTVLELTSPGSEPVVRPTAVQVSGVAGVIAKPGKFLTSSSSSRKWWTLVVVCTANFMLLLDTSIVSVALPKITTDLNASFDQLQWIVDAYSLALAAVLLTAGSLSDILGRRIVFSLGIVLFTVTSAVCGLATDANVLDLARAFQGLGAGLMLAPSLALLAQEFPPAERANAFAAWGAVTAGAIAAGPLVGGLLTQGFGWQAIFWVNVPIGLAAIVVTTVKLVNRPGPPTKIDWFGLVTFSTAIFMIVFALIRGNDEGWGSTLIIALLAGGVIELIVFVIGETQLSSPMLNLSLFRKVSTSGASIVAFCMSASILALIIYLTLWLQSILDYSPLACGLRLLPLTALGLFVKPIAGKFTDRIAPGVICGVGLASIGAGLLLMSQVGTTSKWTVLVPGMILCGFGLGLVSPTLAQVSVGIVPPWQSGMASGINTTFRQLGLVTGIAGLGAIFQHQVLTHVTAALHGTQAAYLTPSFANTVSSGGTVTYIEKAPEAFGPTLKHAASVAFSSGLSEIVTIAGVIAIVGAVLGAVFVRRRDLVGLGPPGGGPPGGSPPGAPAVGGPPVGQAAAGHARGGA